MSALLYKFLPRLRAKSVWGRHWGGPYPIPNTLSGFAYFPFCSNPQFLLDKKTELKLSRGIKVAVFWRQWKNHSQCCRPNMIPNDSQKTHSTLSKKGRRGACYKGLRTINNQCLPFLGVGKTYSDRGTTATLRDPWHRMGPKSQRRYFISPIDSCPPHPLLTILSFLWLGRNQYFSINMDIIYFLL